MERITKRMVAQRFREFVAVLDLEAEPGRTYAMDYATHYGGWRICYIEAGGTAEYTPFGHGRHTSREMFDMLTFAIDAQRLAKEASRARAVAQEKTA